MSNLESAPAIVNARAEARPETSIFEELSAGSALESEGRRQLLRDHYEDRLTAMCGAGISSRASPLRGIERARELADTLAELSLSGEEPRLVVFWGPHPRREAANRADTRTIQMLDELLNDVGFRPQVSVILADSHGQFNGVNNRPYLESVSEEFRGRFNGRSQIHWLSDLYEENGLSSANARLDALAGEAPDSDGSLARALLRGAQKRGGDEEQAQRYAAMRRQEGGMISNLVGNDGVFVVFGGTEYAPLFDDVPGGILFLRARAKSGAGFIDQAPWIDQSRI